MRIYLRNRTQAPVFVPLIPHPVIVSAKGEHR
jgi:hypothetical protein